MTSFSAEVARLSGQKGNLCVVGIDPCIERMSKHFLHQYGPSAQSPNGRTAARILWEFGKMVIDTVHDIVPIIKPQSAYYERYGSHGVRALEKTIAYAKNKELLVVLDAKRGDIAETSEAYAEAYLGENAFGGGIDCITVNPYLGPDSVEPFVKVAKRAGKGVFICVRTSNPGSMAFQNRLADGIPLYRRIAEMVQGFAGSATTDGFYSNIGAVVGATCAEEARIIRQLLPRSIFLVPGLGAQRGSLDVVKDCFDDNGNGAVVSTSRAINYPTGDYQDLDDVRAAIRNAALAFVRDVESCRRNPR